MRNKGKYDILYLCKVAKRQVLIQLSVIVRKNGLPMKIERVDDKTVKCYISNDELQEYDLDYKDFITRSEKAREMVHDIMTQAVVEVGYTPPQYAFDLQIMVVPEQGLVLTFSEKNPEDITEGERLKECLQEMKQVLQKTKARMGLMDGHASAQPEVEKQSAGKEATGRKASEPQEDTRPQFSFFEFASLERIGQLAAVLPVHLRVLSKVYVMGDRYYLYLHRGHAAYERYAKACVQALEFGRLYSAEEETVLFFQEHGDCLIEEKALRKLAKIYG